MARRPAAATQAEPDTRSAVENSNELNGAPQKDAHRSTYATSAQTKPRHHPPPDAPRSAARPNEELAVAATAAEVEEALQEVARRGARIEALTCEVAWYRHWADTYWQQLQSLSAAAAAASSQHQQQQMAAMASFQNAQNAANQNFAAAANFANAAAALGPPHADAGPSNLAGADSAAMGMTISGADGGSGGSSGGAGAVMGGMPGAPGFPTAPAAVGFAPQGMPGGMGMPPQQAAAAAMQQQQQWAAMQQQAAAQQQAQHQQQAQAHHQHAQHQHAQRQHGMPSVASGPATPGAGPSGNGVPPQQRPAPDPSNSAAA